MITPKHDIKKKRKQRLRKSIRKTINGTPEKPRMIIVRSNKYLYAQIIDDVNGNVLASASTLEKDMKGQLKSTKDKEAAKLMGKVIAQRLKEKKIDSVIFDRNIYPFSGRVKVFADSARENGIKF
ncbi:MAG: 50S ribosomal protein L18 [Candidatus Aminicenantes bacterium]|nr:50S ribosomal protein L18 [Candidatus Aminicenantes bacterium]NIM81541.1 50S ribosomal protein L18 [Candidatus Aminicenantes bacterium]NIN20912.1 50S ribosomal protein L18 [Candidatus Aminicenantes bacterium]NIN44733.1 50S ribosomal protein L18 [Candidatus Aminicenantes bacterium]NIN87541.1 50S ribosomal protein L18 [Candidatus Aminicenantes bacterium]